MKHQLITLNDAKTLYDEAITFASELTPKLQIVANQLAEVRDFMYEGGTSGIADAIEDSNEQDKQAAISVIEKGAEIEVLIRKIVSICQSVDEAKETELTDL